MEPYPKPKHTTDKVSDLQITDESSRLANKQMRVSDLQITDEISGFSSISFVILTCFS